MYWEREGKLVWVGRDSVKAKNAKRNQYFPNIDSVSLRKHVGGKIEKEVGEGGSFAIWKYFHANVKI